MNDTERLIIKRGNQCAPLFHVSIINEAGEKYVGLENSSKNGKANFGEV